MSIWDPHTTKEVIAVIVSLCIMLPFGLFAYRDGKKLAEWLKGRRNH